MSLTPEQSRARAKKAARARWHGDGAGVAVAAAELERANEHAAVERQIDALVAGWRSATPEQKDRIRRLFNPPAPRGTGTG